MQKKWLSIHTFYYDDQNFLIVHCLAPLIDVLREQGLIQRYFFMRYWAEGPHVRLRLLPAPEADDEKIKYLAEKALREFLEKRPALYGVNHQKAAPIYKRLFIAEYGEAKWLETYGQDGVMPIRRNNSFAYIDYEPEYKRYGGEDGVALSEWHFEHSSDMVISLLRETNTSVRSILLGRSMQLTFPFFYSMFVTDEKVQWALDRYIANWLPAGAKGRTRLKQYAGKYPRMALVLQQRIEKMRSYMVEDEPLSLMTAAEKSWKRHLGEFRVSLLELYHEQKIVFPDENKQQPEIGETFEQVYNYLHSSYVHMTNNRLGVLISEEVYIVYLLKCTLEEMLDNQLMEAI